MFHNHHPRPTRRALVQPSIGASKVGPGDVKQVDSAWVIEGVGSFQNRAIYSFDQDDMPVGLLKSNYICNHRDMAGPQPIPYNVRYDPDNVAIKNGVLALTVPGGQNPDGDPDNAVSCAEITTAEQNILYASVRTNAIFSQVPGTCHGLFFYKSDCQEIDIEYLTDPNSLSNKGKTNPLWFSNQATDPEKAVATQSTGPTPSNCTNQVHEYRIDWTPEYTAFFVDGNLQENYSTNVPSQPGPWVWNNWANGDKGWSVGPPLEDNVLQIQSITMYYNIGDSNDLAEGSAKRSNHDKDDCDDNGRRP